MKPKNKGAAALQSGEPLQLALRDAKHLENRLKRRSKQYITVARGDGSIVTVTGREAQTLDLLICCGVEGFTSGEISPLGWARRTSHYILQLRKTGIQIQTDWEKAGDARIGRYRLIEPLKVMSPLASALSTKFTGVLSGD